MKLSNLCIRPSTFSFRHNSKPVVVSRDIVNCNEHPVSLLAFLPVDIHQPADAMTSTKRRETCFTGSTPCNGGGFTRLQLLGVLHQPDSRAVSLPLLPPSLRPALHSHLFPLSADTCPQTDTFLKQTQPDSNTSGITDESHSESRWPLFGRSRKRCRQKASVLPFSFLAVTSSSNCFFAPGTPSRRIPNTFGCNLVGSLTIGFSPSIIACL